MEGMLSVELIELQKYALVESTSRLTIDKWAKELVIRLLEITHGQWLYRNVMVHDRTAGELASPRKEEIRRALEEQLELGGEGLEDEDKYLLEIHLDDLGTSSGEDQTYWLLSLRAARVAFQIQELCRQGGGTSKKGLSSMALILSSPFLQEHKNLQ